MDWKRFRRFEGPSVGRPGVFAKVSWLWWRSGVVLKSIGTFRRGLGAELACLAKIRRCDVVEAFPSALRMEAICRRDHIFF